LLVIIWLDTGNPLIIDRPSLLTKALQDNMHIHEEIFLPWIREHSFTSAQASILRTNQLVTQTEPGVSHPHLDYGRTLDKQAMAQDPFYALHELLTTASYSEMQFLNVLESRIMEEEVKLGPCDKISPANMIYFEELLDKHADTLRRNISMIKTRDEWPQPSDPKIAKHTAAEAQALLRNYEHLLERTGRLSHKCKRRQQILMNTASIAEANKAVEQAKAVTKLTRLAFFFIPLSFVSSFFGMNSKLSTSALANSTVFVWAVVAVALLVCASYTDSWLSWALNTILAIRVFVNGGPSRKEVESSLECGGELWEDGHCIPQNHIMLQPNAPGSSTAFNLPQHDNTSSIFSEGASLASICASDETSDSTDSSLDGADTDSIEDLASQKTQVVDHLMVHVHDMFALPDVRKCKGGSGSGSSTSINQGNEKTAKGLPSYGPKRTLFSRGRRATGEDQDEQDDDDGGRRRKTTKPYSEQGSVDDKRLACPYYKRDPHAHKSSKACAGPGWYKMHRLK
jgi:hypothetical protein